MNTTRLFFLLTGVLCLISACQQPASPPSIDVDTPAYPVTQATIAVGYPAPQTQPEISVTPVTEISTPQPGMATLTGRVLSDRSRNPVVNVPVRLAEVFYEGDQGAYVLDGAQSPGTLTDNEGRFLFVDLEARDYVIVIGNIEVNDYVIISEPSGRARVWTANANEVLDVNVLRVTLQYWD